MPNAGSNLRKSPLFALALAATALCTTGLVAVAANAPAPVVMARPAPNNFADLADQLSATVVNISTSQMLKRPKPPVAENQQGKAPGQNGQSQNGQSQNGQAQNGQGQKSAPQDQDQETEDLFRDFLERGQSTPRRVSSLGSGFVIDPSGLIVTNNHVIEDADEINVTLNDGTTMPAEIIGRDTQTDLALLQVKPRVPLTAAKFGDSDKSRVGEWVMAIGNPFGLGGSVTAGIISARNRDINAGPYDDYIQTDAPINRGNSGGPLFNMDGEVVGVNSAIYSPSGGSVGIGFAIPSAIVKSIVLQLKQGGGVHRGLLGVRIQAVTPEIAESLGLELPHGAMVAGVTKDGPAAKAGIQVGDLILNFDNRPVADLRALPRLVADAQAGKTASVDVLRHGERKTIAVTIGKLQSDDVASAPATPKTASAAHKSATRLGLTLAAITPDLRTRYRIAADVSGVVVTDVDLDGPSAEKNIRAGDVIAEIAQQKVNSPLDATAKLDTAAKSGKNVVLLSVVRGGELSFVGVRLAGG